jgi:hypothetical protein
MAAGLRIMADPFVFGGCTPQRQLRASEIVRQRLVAHGLLEHLPDVAACQQHQAVDAVGAEPDLFAHVQAEVRVLRQFRAGVEQAQIVVRGQRIGQRFERVVGQADGAGECLRRHAARQGGLEQRLQVGAGDPALG